MTDPKTMTVDEAMEKLYPYIYEVHEIYYDIPEVRAILEAVQRFGMQIGNHTDEAMIGNYKRGIAHGKNAMTQEVKRWADKLEWHDD